MFYFILFKIFHEEIGVRSEDLYKLMCVQGVQRQDATQCAQPGVLYKQSINHTEFYMHNSIINWDFEYVTI